MGFNLSWKDLWDLFEQIDPEQQDSMRPELKTIISQSSKGVKEEILKYAPEEFKQIDSYELSPAMLNLIRKSNPPMSDFERKKVDELLARAKEREKKSPSRYVQQEQRYMMRRGMYSIFRSLFGGRY